MMVMCPTLLAISLIVFLASCINAQQGYSGNSVLSCHSSDDSGPSPAFLYTCNGQLSCQAFLIFKSDPPYNSVPTISMLMSTSPGDLAGINDVTKLAVFPTGKEVIVPVNCSCSGQYYQANTTFQIPDNQHTYFIIGNNTYQGLSTCDSLMRANSYGEFSLSAGLELHVPLRCACPTKQQVEDGTKYLLTYSVGWHDNFLNIGARFNAGEWSIRDANGFVPGEYPALIFPFTTILVPLETEPSSSQTKTHGTRPPLDPPPPASDSRSRRSKRRLYLGAGIAAGCFLLGLSIFFSVVFLPYKERTKKVPKRKTKSVLPEDLLVEIASVDTVLKVFEFKKLKKATGNFSSKSRMKGSVFRAELEGETVAVKEMKVDALDEVNILSKLNHINLIKLHGVCNNGSCFYLVFEYLENGSLREWLRKESSKHNQSWSMRIQIALDVANGLHYLHNFTKPAYVHKQIKSSNILLTKNLRAKIANFSLARTAVKRAKTSALISTLVVGTRGYMAPEYVDAGLMTPTVDVYAFGVVMLELITGKDAIFVQDEEEVLLSASMISIMERGNPEIELSQFLDPCLLGNNGIESAIRIAKLSVTCLRKDPASRPSMGEVATTLLKIQLDLRKSEMQFEESV